MLDWLWKWFGYHVCDEFTRWQTKVGTYERPATMDESVWANVATVTFTRRWQERECTICGRLQQREIKQ